MLRLTTRSARRASPSYICNACTAARHAAFASPSLRPAGLVRPPLARLLSFTTPRLDDQPTEQASEAPAEAPATTSEDVENSTAPKGKNKKSEKKKSKKPPMTPALQGAIETFKKVLAEQNVDLVHLTKILDHEPPGSKKKKKGKKEKAKAKEAKGAKKEKSKKKAAKNKDPPTNDKDAAPVEQQPPIIPIELPVTPIEPCGEAGIGGERQDVLGKPFGEEPVKNEETTQNEETTKDEETAENDEPAEAKEKPAELAITTVRSKSLSLTPIGKLRIPVPKLSYGLDRVLFNPGVYFLQDPRSRVYNFDPYLANIMPIQEFDFNALKAYITSSKDTTLISKALEHKKRYTGSTSSMTAMLSHFHYLLSSWRPINSAMMSNEFKPESKRFTKIMRAPAATFLHWKDGCYAIDADKEFDSANILSMLGKSMEKLLTLPKHKFEQYRHVNSDQISEEERNADEAYHYTGFQDFMMRSQLDAHDSRIPGTGMFDLKTRAVISIRMDAKDFHKGLGYEIRTRLGQWESYEREYYDMIRSAFLKYSLQVRMGRMDGIYVAYHNTQRIFGFQYIPIPEMDYALHGTYNTTLGDREYKLSLTLLNDLLDRASKKWPERSLRIHFETRESVVAPFMYVFARPVTQGEIEAVQNAGRAQVEEFERKMLGLGKDKGAKKTGEGDEQTGSDDVQTSGAATEAEDGLFGENEFEEDVELEEDVDQAEESSGDADAQRLAAWHEVQQMVEDAMSDEELGVSSVREAIQNALEESSLLEVESTTEARQYIDALLAAITGVQPPAKEASSEAQAEAEETPTVESSDEGHQETAATPEPEVASETTSTENTCTEAAASEASATETPTSESAQTSELDESVTPSSSEQVKPSDSEIVSAIEDVIDSKRASPAIASISPLKDLIALSAQRIHESPADVTQPEGLIEDSPKLKVFEQILGQMISRAKAQQSGSLESEDTSQESAATTGAEISGEATEQKVYDPLDPDDEARHENISEEATEQEEEEEDFELLGMVLTIKNKVNGKYVERPENMAKDDEWEVEYNIEELPSARAHTLYKQCLKRREQIFTDVQDKSDYGKMYGGQLIKSVQRGREFRKKEEILAKRRQVHVYGSRSFKYREIFGRGGRPSKISIARSRKQVKGAKKLPLARFPRIVKDGKKKNWTTGVSPQFFGQGPMQFSQPTPQEGSSNSEETSSTTVQESSSATPEDSPSSGSQETTSPATNDSPSSTSQGSSSS